MGEREVVLDERDAKYDDDDDVLDELDEKKEALDDEEEKILRELQELESIPQTGGVSAGGSGGGGGAGGGKGSLASSGGVGGKRGGKAEPQSPGTVALNSILLECEKEVRDSKGYVAEGGPPLKIIRCKPGQTTPKHAKYLSKPKDTGVDFTVPVKVAGYTTIIKSPITLNQIRDRCKHNKYRSSEDYLSDMKLLASNTATFNASEEVQWIVQHAELLLEAAEDALEARKARISEAEETILAENLAREAAAREASHGKRKRESNGLASAGDAGHPLTKQNSKRGRVRSEGGVGNKQKQAETIQADGPQAVVDTRALEDLKQTFSRRMDDLVAIVEREVHSTSREMRHMRKAVEAVSTTVRSNTKSLIDRVVKMETRLDASLGEISMIHEMLSKRQGESQADVKDSSPRQKDKGDDSPVRTDRKSDRSGAAPVPILEVSEVRPADGPSQSEDPSNAPSKTASNAPSNVEMIDLDEDQAEDTKTASSVVEVERPKKPLADKAESAEKSEADSEDDDAEEEDDDDDKAETEDPNKPAPEKQKVTDPEAVAT